ncbi:serine hydrolase domain-containing protein [Lutibacter citreus]|uniref:serine hydrolase domain-containing protein n=1 Tax=Lutibacter citreus TaxID=2138210 RepID=UPI000DBE10A1|nr:serine hydrolase domain-containing protein [Lutibacter citreus]
MKKNIKFLALAILVISSSFIFISNSNPPPKIVKEIDIPIKKELPVLVKKTTDTIVKKVVNNKLDSLLQRINKRYDFNGSLLVSKNGETLYSSQIGLADFKKKEPLSKSSVFQLASVSKQFTAAAIMLLYERNQIKLTDSVTNYFPKFPYEGVTIKNLLNHTAGLPKYFWAAEHLWKQKRAPTNSEMMTLLASSHVQRFFKPGRNFDYSNTGYFVLASIIEKVSGTSFSNFIKDNIFDPLKMDNSFVYSCTKDNFKTNQLNGYRLYRGWRHLKIGSTINDAIVGDKNIYATSEDLIKWVTGLNSGKLLTKESVEMMYSKGETSSGRKIPYGFGFRIDKENENTIYHHGKWNGFSTSITQYQKDKLVVIVLEHTSYNSITALNKTVKEIVMDNVKS